MAMRRRFWPHTLHFGEYTISDAKQHRSSRTGDAPEDMTPYGLRPGVVLPRIMAQFSVYDLERRIDERHGECRGVLTPQIA
jgi:hypothetical protein